ncbi:EAL domain-containing protein [Sulfurimonas lithotrophica]|uniref:EAL domain-containing protein n=1 Tax=Sulfurimonas lithotrophica TaxID=2590022 RepID=A0A5P8NYV6_9BACT|nr:GGDEF domain-containing phosphodiesterase [Sulfurimonas lithotrophica]QFR48619.1 EAL domain-containing protein [Sulfurimonas lithotrophica]
MRFKLNSLSFKTVSLLILTSTIFITLGYTIAKNTFSKNYEDVIHEKIDIVLRSISPQISLNLSYGFNDSIDEICKEQLKNKNVLLIKIESDKLKQDSIYKQHKKISTDFSKFSSEVNLIDPSTSNIIGKLTLLYSSESYYIQMQKFYQMAVIGGFIFIVSLVLISIFLLKSLKPLSKLAHSMNEFNPYEPKKLNVKATSQDEIGSIIKSANIMVENLISYIEHSSALTQELSKKQQHLNDAQRIASVGSWEYDVTTNKLNLSDEIYRILGIKKKSNLTFSSFLNLTYKDDLNDVLNTINNAIEKGSVFNIKYRIQLHNNKIAYVRTKGKVRKKSSGDIKLTAVTVDITKDTHNEQMIERLAYYDSLTNLPNRILFKDRVKSAISNAKRHKNKIAIMFLDLDNFKIVNDTLGHSVGDKLLIHVAKLLSSILRENDTISRVGGDEFTILLTDIQSEEDAQKIAKKIFDSLQGEHEIDFHRLLISTSIGIAIYPDSALDIDKLIRNADTAMYEAKKADKNNYKVFNNKMYAKIKNFVKVEKDLRIALDDEKAFEIFYQPKIKAQDGFVSGCEALVRWKHPKKGIIYPDEFIDIAEESALIIPIGNKIIEKTIKDLSEFNSKGYGTIKVAINLSAKQFTDNSLIGTIQKAIEKYDVHPSQLEFEITESISMQNISKTLEVLHQLKQTGVSIAIDDFGTGYSSLSYLKQFPINTLKIDKSFVLDMTIDNDDKSIVNTIINMAHTLNFTTVAEGVETLEHADILTDMNCDELQGYYYSKPIAKDEFINFLKTYNTN